MGLPTKTNTMVVFFRITYKNQHNGYESYVVTCVELCYVDESYVVMSVELFGVVLVDCMITLSVWWLLRVIIKTHGVNLYSDTLQAMWCLKEEI